jgi:hypothetical protein
MCLVRLISFLQPIFEIATVVITCSNQHYLIEMLVITSLLCIIFFVIDKLYFFMERENNLK